MSQVRCRLSRLLAHDDGLRLNETERVNDDLALDGLDGINNNSNCAGRKLLEGLLRIDIDRGKPATKTRMRVIPADDSLGTSITSRPVSFQASYN